MHPRGEVKATPKSGTIPTSQWPAAVTAITAIGALIFTGLSLNATRDQIVISERGLATQQLNKAVEQLASEKIDVRLGGIYSLERLAGDSIRDRIAIITIISAYVREHALKSNTPDCDSMTEPAIDIQAGIYTIGQISAKKKYEEGKDWQELPKIDLSGTCLVGLDAPGVDLEGAKFDNANLRRSDLSGAQLSAASIKNAKFDDARLNQSYLNLSTISDSTFTDANLQLANISQTTWGNVDIKGARMWGANRDRTKMNRTNIDLAIFTDVDGLSKILPYLVIPK